MEEEGGFYSVVISLLAQFLQATICSLTPC